MMFVGRPLHKKDFDKPVRLLIVLFERPLHFIAHNSHTYFVRQVCSLGRREESAILEI